MLLASWGLQAQDTVYASRPPSNYLLPFGDWWDTIDTVAYGGGGTNGGDYAFFFYTEDTVDVYGIAGSFWYEGDWPNWSIDDYPLDQLAKVGECMRLYEYDSLPHQIGEDLCMNLHPKSITYFFQLINKINVFGEQLRTVPVYERYFDTPQKVCDTFLVGFTQQTRISAPGPLQIHCDGFYPYKTSPEVFWWYPCFAQYIKNGEYIWKRGWCVGQVEFFLYPILTPDSNMRYYDDSTNVGIGTSRLVERCVAVTPNPAKEKVKVASSFGIVKVEAFNSSGQMVFKAENPRGLAISVDVSAWPVGAYIFHVHTQQGIVTRKILISR